MMLYINLFSEFYLSFFFFLFLFIIIFLNLSKEKNYPNYYNSLCYLVILALLNSIFIDIWNRIDNYVSYDLFKNSSDIYFKYFIVLFTIFFLIYSNFYVNKMKFNEFEYLILILFIVMSFNFFILVVDVISFYLLLEIQSFGLYLLTAMNKKNQYSIESGLKYFVLSSFSSIILLFGFSFLYGITGTLNLSEYSFFFTNIEWNNSSFILFTFNILLITLAFFFKLYVAPFHIWISDIYQGAPTMSTAFFATITTLPLFYFFLKFYLIFFYIIENYLYYFIFSVVVLSMFVGSISALYQKKIKRLIAFSSVGNIGYILVGFLQENPLLLSNAITYFLMYVISTMSIFVVFLNLYIKKSNFFLERLSMLSGFLVKNRLLALILILFFFTAAGMPPFSLFYAKILLLTGLSYQLYSILLFIMVFTSILSSFYYLRIIKIMSFEKNNNYLFLSPIKYINLVLIFFLCIINFFIFLYSEYITLISDYIVLNLY